MLPSYCSREYNNNTNNTRDIRDGIEKSGPHHGGGHKHNHHSSETESKDMKW